MDVYDAAERYYGEGVPLIILAGKDYGSGSSRDWAAKGPWILVCVCVCVCVGVGVGVCVCVGGCGCGCGCGCGWVGGWVWVWVGGWVGVGVGGKREGDREREKVICTVPEQQRGGPGVCLPS